jgi:hypothetical protein
MSSNDARNWGRIGGLTAWSRHGVDTMLSPARKGFAARFERQVLASAQRDGETLTASELARRTDRLRRSYMLTLAARSAEVRRTRKAAPAGKSAGAAKEVADAGGEPQREG